MGRYTNKEIKNIFVNAFDIIEKSYLELEDVIKNLPEMPDDIENGIVGSLIRGKAISNKTILQRVDSLNEKEKRPGEFLKTSAVGASLMLQLEEYSKARGIPSRKQFFKMLRQLRDDFNWPLDEVISKKIRTVSKFGSLFNTNLYISLRTAYGLEAAKDSLQRNQIHRRQFDMGPCTAYSKNTRYKNTQSR